jgi:P27 family predicted phage terminase small subunit
MPGRKPIPMALKLLRGNPGHEKLNHDAPQPSAPVDVLEPPAFLPPYAQEEWHRLAGELHALRLLTVADVKTFAAYCGAYATWRRTEEELARAAREECAVAGGLLVRSAQGDKANPLLSISRKAAADLVRYGTEFGLTPVSRGRLSIAPSRAPNKFSGLLAE